MNRIDWRTVSADDIHIDPEDLEKKLLPVVHGASRAEEIPVQDYGEKLVTACKIQIAKVLPLHSTEMEFLDLLLDKGEISPELLTIDSELQEKIRSQPLLQWKALHVKNHKGI